MIVRTGGRPSKGEISIRIASHGLAVIGVGIVALGLVWAADGPTTVSGIRTTSQSRATYLARATIWHDPGALSPTDVLQGPSGALPYTFEQANSDEGIGCSFTQAGKELSGNSPKFICRTADGHNLRLKYWDPVSQSGNREVFTTVAASRAMWAMGFEAVPTLHARLFGWKRIGVEDHQR